MNQSRNGTDRIAVSAVNSDNLCDVGEAHQVGEHVMNENQTALRRFRWFWTKSYGRSALICFLVGRAAAQYNMSDDRIEGAVTPLILEDLGNIGFLVFAVLGVARMIKNRRSVTTD